MCSPTTSTKKDGSNGDEQKKLPQQSVSNNNETQLTSNPKEGTGLLLTNEKWILTTRPKGQFNPKTNVQLITETITSCPEDQIIVKVDVLSVDAFIRTTLDESAYHGSTPLNAVLPAIGYGTIVHVGNNVGSSYKVGQSVQGMLGSQTYAIVSTSLIQKRPSLPFITETSSLGILGLTTGLTAYTGMFYVTDPPRKHETVVISAASGAVGSIACQLAKHIIGSHRVIGIAGGPHKRSYLLNELGLDGVVDYKCSKRTVEEQLKEYCPDGIDFFYDNVGGEILNEVLGQINPNARVVICGAISQYSGNLNHEKKNMVVGPSNYLALAEKGATMKGFNVMKYLNKALKMVFWMWYYTARGKISMKEHVEEGIGQFPFALDKMFTGGHLGKMLVDVRRRSSSSTSSEQQ